MLFHDVVKSVCGVCCTAVVVCASGVSEGMDDILARMPTRAYSENEGAALSKYHSIVSKKNTQRDSLHMPRTEDEMVALYDFYNSDV